MTHNRVPAKSSLHIKFILFSRWSEIGEELTILLDEESTNAILCALHSEMKNTEQLLGSLGLFANRCGSLEECNEAISHCGPELSRVMTEYQ